MSIGNSLAGLFGLGETEPDWSFGIVPTITSFPLPAVKNDYLDFLKGEEVKNDYSSIIESERRINKNDNMQNEILAQYLINNQLINDQMIIQNGSYKQRNMAIALSAAAIASLALYYMYKK